MQRDLPNIDFEKIRPLNGKQLDGFEELSVQLFRGETTGDGEFYPVEGSGGDGGVEAYRKRPDGTKIGVQAKYFDKLGSDQWPQITKSVKSALKNHPTLVSYTVAVPLNRPPAQIKKWESLVREWSELAAESGLTQSIDFIWWGYTELAGLLIKPEYRNQLIYWFGLPDFSLDWLESNSRSNIKLLGKRYSPKQHIDTESGVRLEAFAWADDGKRQIVNAYLEVARHWREFERGLAREDFDDPEVVQLMEAYCSTMKEISSFRWPSSGYPRIRSLNKQCQQAIAEKRALSWRLEDLDQAEKKKGGHSEYGSGPYSGLIYDLREQSQSLSKLQEATTLCSAADDSILLLSGEAGSGKSHLIADILTSAMNRSQPALLLLGEQYLSDDDPWTASAKILGWNQSTDELLAALDQEAVLAGRPALICIDALNESSQRRLWHSHLIQFAERVSRYSHVKLLVSCRSDFANITLPESIRPGSATSWPSLEHQGFGAELIDAIEVYFSEFNIEAAYFPPALAEFRNPLFLRVFCEAFKGQTLPHGPLGFDRVMGARIDRLCERVNDEIDCDPEDTRAAIRAIAKELGERGGRPIPRKLARDCTIAHFPNRDTSGSLSLIHI